MMENYLVVIIEEATYLATQRLKARSDGSRKTQ